MRVTVDHLVPSSQEWDVRLLMERSKATVSPCASYHLAGTKKVQQALAAPGVLERYMCVCVCVCVCEGCVDAGVCVCVHDA